MSIITTMQNQKLIEEKKLSLLSKRIIEPLGKSGNLRYQISTFHAVTIYHII